MENFYLLKGIPLNRTPKPHLSPALGFTLRFFFICLLMFLLIENAPDTAFYPLNRVNTLLSAILLKVFGLAPLTRGITIELDGFHAQVIGECSTVFTSVLPVAFIMAYPSRFHAKILGILSGLTVIFWVNVLRIGALVMAGAYAPQLFDPLHLYGGQTAMILLVVFVCMSWVRWVRGGSNGETTTNKRRFWETGLRWLLFSSAAFAVLYLIREPYTWLQYGAARSVLGWFGIKVGLPQVLRLYPDTFLCFNYVTFTLLAGLFGPKPARRCAYAWISGMAVLTALHFCFRILQMLCLSSPPYAGLGWLVTFLLVVNEWMLPFGLWLWLARRIHHR